MRDLNLGERWLNVRETAQDRGKMLFGGTKSAAGTRMVDDLPHDLCQRLRAHVAGRAPSDYVFSLARDHAKPYRHKNFVNRVWRPTCRALGISARFHHLRHWHASAILQVTADPMYTCQRLGHESPEFTMRVYGHVLHRRGRGVAAGLSAHLAEAQQDNAARVPATTPSPVAPQHRPQRAQSPT